MKDYPHTYTGPHTRDGLKEGQVCKVVGKRAGGYQIIVPQDKRVYIVAMSHVKTKQDQYRNGMHK